MLIPTMPRSFWDNIYTKSPLNKRRNPLELDSFSVDCPVVLQNLSSAKSLSRDYQKVWPLHHYLTMLPTTFVMGRMKRSWFFTYFLVSCLFFYLFVLFSQDHTNNKCTCHCYQLVFQFDCQYRNNFYVHGDLKCETFTSWFNISCP